MSDNFYRAFEDRYRGSRATIGARLRAYLPLIAPLAAQRPARALDIGCGRGEWLELAAEAGFDAAGVDLDDGMLALCRERGLDVRTADGIATLRECAADSLAIVSAFHVVEHIAFDDVRTLIAEALRALRPGGLLILETPNPENLVVGASSFYRDPSHLRPLPPELLAFAAEYGGFARHAVLRLQHDPALAQAATLQLHHVLEGVSPDYAVVAQKAAPAALLAQFDAAFAGAGGISLGQITGRYDEQAARARAQAAAQQAELAQTQAALAQTQAGLAHLETHVVAGKQDLWAAGSRIDALAGQQASLAGQLASVAECQAQLNAILNSRSWRLSAPLRRAEHLARRLRNALRANPPAALLRRRLKQGARALGRLALRNRAAKRAARALLARFPRLQARLRRLMYQAPVAAGAAPPLDQQVADLSPRAQRLYHALKRARPPKEP